MGHVCTVDSFASQSTSAGNQWLAKAFASLVSSLKSVQGVQIHARRRSLAPHGVLMGTAVRTVFRYVEI